MAIKISQHEDNICLLLSILAYFKSNSKIYRSASMKIVISGHKLWETTVFNHYSKYLLHGIKVIRLNKFFAIRALMLNNNHLMKVDNYRKWKPDVKLKILKIWNS